MADYLDAAMFPLERVSIMNTSRAMKWIRRGSLATILAGSLVLAPQAGASPRAFCAAGGVDACSGSDWGWAVDDAAQYCSNSCSYSVTSCSVTWYCDPEISYDYSCGPAC